MTEEEYKILETATNVTITLLMRRAAREDRSMNDEELATARRLYNKLQLASVEKEKARAKKHQEDKHNNDQVIGRQVRAYGRVTRRR